MKLIYVAGPFRGETDWDIAQNVRYAETLGYEVMELGHMPVVPHSMTRNYHGERDDAWWLAGTLELMRRCDGVLLTYDWQDSEGARAEVKEASRLGLPLFFDTDDLAAWKWQCE